MDRKQVCSSPLAPMNCRAYFESCFYHLTSQVTLSNRSLF